MVAEGSWRKFIVIILALRYMPHNLVQYMVYTNAKGKLCQWKWIRTLSMKKVVVGHIQVLHKPSAYHYAGIFTNDLPSPLFNKYHSSLRQTPSSFSD